MGVYIPNMSKPKGCYYCPLEQLSECRLLDNKFVEEIDPKHCPLIEIDLVRCGECKWWNEETHGCNRNPCVKAWWETDYCSYGERK